jgi:hypothetical protein
MRRPFFLAPKRREKNEKKVSVIFIGLFYLAGEPISPHLLLCDPFAVDHHSGMGQASHLQQPFVG